MCIMFYDGRKTTDVVTKEEFERCQAKHPDGLGIMYANKHKQLVVWTSMDDLKGLYTRYRNARAAGYAVAVHFRRGTTGANNILENCHPFEIVPGEFGFMHNGTIGPLTGLLPEKCSDTRLLNDELFRNWPVDFLARPVYRKLIDQLITGDRLLFMDAEGHHTIIGEKSQGGYWDKGLWWSNDHDKSYIATGKEYTYLTPTTDSAKTAAKSGFYGAPGDEWVMDGGVWKPVKADKTTGVGGKGTSEQERKSTFFNYGLFGDDEMQFIGAQYVGVGLYDNHELFAISDLTVKPTEFRPAVFNVENKSVMPVSGTLWLLDDTAEEMLRDIELGSTLRANYFHAMAKVRVKDKPSVRAIAFTHAAFQTGYQRGSQYPLRGLNVYSGEWNLFESMISRQREAAARAGGPAPRYETKVLFGPSMPVTPTQSVVVKLDSSTDSSPIDNTTPVLVIKKEDLKKAKAKKPDPFLEEITGTTSDTPPKKWVPTVVARTPTPARALPSVGRGNLSLPKGVSGAPSTKRLFVPDIQSPYPPCPHCKDIRTAVFVILEGDDKGKTYGWCYNQGIDFIAGDNPFPSNTPTPQAAIDTHLH